MHCSLLQYWIPLEDRPQNWVDPFVDLANVPGRSLKGLVALKSAIKVAVSTFVIIEFVG
jgi:hypothetical protein